MNLPNQNTLLGKLANLIFVYSPLFNYLRDRKDRLFQPISQFCASYHISPWLLSITGLIFGLLSLLALFFGYWYFVVLMSISLVFDFIDGSLARHTQQVSSFGKYLDFVIDHLLMILMVIALCHYLKCYYWLLGAGFFSIALYINVLTYAPMHIPSGRITLFVPCLFGVPQLGLLLLTLYGLVMAMLMLSQLLTPAKGLFAQATGSNSGKDPRIRR